jgi:serine/threonine protein kinase
MVFSIRYSPPEFFEKYVSNKYDTWGFACIVNFIFFSQEPWEGLDPNKIKKSIPEKIT